MPLEFDPAEHVYRLDGQRVPSVTQVLEPLQQLEGIPADALETARVRGWHVHAACALLFQKQLEWKSVDTSIFGYVRAAERFVTECGVQVLMVEKQVADPGLKIAGTIDLIGVMPAIGRHKPTRTAVIDWKAVAQMSRTTALQTAGYDHLFRRNFGGRPLDRYAVQLFDDETYKVWKYEDPRDVQWFMSALNLWHWKQAA